jgi:hypothetical protein
MSVDTVDGQVDPVDLSDGQWTALDLKFQRLDAG